MTTIIHACPRRLNVAFALVLLSLLLVSGVAFGQEAPVVPAENGAVAAEAAPAEPAPPPPAEGSFYINPLWLLLVAVAAVVWLYATSWICDDARGVGISFPTYTTALLGGGWVVFLLAALVHAAFGFLLLLIVAAAFVVYVVLRNSVVPERHRLLGSHHWAQMFARVPGLSKLAALKPRTRAQRPSFVIKNADGRTADDIVAERPTLSEAADALIEFVLRAGATKSRKIRVQPAGEQFVVQFVMDGVLHNVEAFEPELGQQILALAADLAGLTQAGRMRQGSGQVFADLPGMGQADVGVQIAASAGKPILQLNLPDWTYDLHRGGLEPLGVHESIVKRMKATLEQNRGALIVCGPPECGKTTTLLALAGAIDALTTDIALLGLAGRHKLEHVRDWDIPTDRSFSDFYVELLREGPGAIVLDSLDDTEHAQKAMHFACEEGLSLGGLKAADAPHGLALLARLAGAPEQINRAVTCVVPQRLVRRLCPACREEVEPNPALLQKLGIDPEDPGTWYRPVGCEACLGCGYQGRTGLFGMLILTDPVKEALRKPDVTPEAIRDAAGKAAFRTMYQDGIAKVTAGVTTLEEVRRVLKG
jgi:type II secretory ATPase GspE/PulE/Tfp pilus assembly ATPase PilB-like protein